jgi:hypothetical protein
MWIGLKNIILCDKSKMQPGANELMPVILVTQEAEIRRIEV